MISINKKKLGINPILVSNRLPIKLEKIDGLWQVLPGSGGLVTALAPVLKNNQSCWIGWTGAPLNSQLRQLLDQSISDIGYDLEPIDLTEEEINGFYYGFTNEALWPLFHDLLDHCNFDVRQWETYQSVNYKFAAAIANRASDDNFIWVQDYHLMMVGHFLSEMGFKNCSSFFLHIPFPPKDIFIKLPWRQEILEALLSYRLVGFQTERDRRNFIHCLKYLLPAAQISHHRSYPYVRHEGQTTRIGAFPISIDFRAFDSDARSKDVADAAWYIHENYPKQKIILGVDRLDYTKGIPHRLIAFENCLERYPELKERICLIQIVVPSRTEVSEYQQLKRQIDELVGRINSRFTNRGWVPIHYIYKTLSRTELLGYYRSSEVALITPLKDGMNLVAKEYCAASIEEKGVLILSEFAGAAVSLKDGAIMVNPYNIEEVANSIYHSFYMDIDEQQRRMRKMRGVIRKNNIYKWVDQFVKLSDYQTNENDQNSGQNQYPETVNSSR